MLNLGLTGGIGSGKSTAARRLREIGAVVIDADAVAREVLADGTPGLAQVVERFGPAMMTSDGSLDRAALARTVFGDESARETLEGITHPLIADRTRLLYGEAEQGGAQIVVHDVPLLVEKRMGPRYHLVLVVDASRGTRLARLAGRGVSEADALARMEHQASDGARRHVADVLLDNEGDEAHLFSQIDRVWHERLVPFAEALIAGRPTRSAGRDVTGPYDPEWSAQADRLVARLGHVLGEFAPQIEHIGSTAVPGMDGKAVIDIQVGVRDLREADAPEFVAAMAAAGFPRIDAVRMDHPTSDLSDPSLWIKRYHGSCDPGLPAHIHVRELESAGWQYALLFRDWLRADPSARTEYVNVKESAHAGAGSSEEYAAAKEPWFDEVWPRMQAWARRSGWHD